MLKAFLPAIIFYYIFDKYLVVLYIAGVSSVFGHIYPVVWKFKGGKGIAYTVPMTSTIGVAIYQFLSNKK
jgi:glycerol-3-phosphate acyltransferase PlsY